MTVVAFDLDGTLVDSRAAILASVRVALAAHGFPAEPDDDLAFLIGPPIRVGMEELLRRLGQPTRLADDVLSAYRAHYGQTMLEATPPFPGMAEVVRRLARAGTACVVTSKPQVFAEAIVGHVGLLEQFAFVEGPALDAPDEPKKQTLARALERLPSIGAMVGDRHHDVDAGRAHGLRTVGVTWGIGDRAELEEAGADVLVDTPAELAAVLLG